MKKNRTYDSAFKEQTLELIGNGNKKVNEVARDLGIPVSTIHTWIRQKGKYKDNIFPGKGNPRDKEIYDLKKQLADVKMERDILKKAIAIFSRQNR